MPGMTPHPLARTIEECCLNAWPGLQQQVLEGWMLRFAGGYTRRANSVQTLHGAEGDVHARLRECEAAYGARGYACTFKITPLARPAGLDAILERAGYRREGETSVQVLDPLPAARPHPGCVLTDALGEDWQRAFARLDGTPRAHLPTRRAILGKIALPHTAGLLRTPGTEGTEGAVAACGRAVAEQAQVGLFDLATDPAHRGRGLAGHLAGHLLAWGARQGATRAYLQVEVDNAPALRLYARLGFRELYRYWYRVR